MQQAPQIDATRMAQVQALDIASGGHRSFSEGMCAMEAVSYVAGEPWSDTPQCACPVISTFLRSWNDALPGDERNALLKELIPKIIGTRSTPEIERRRATMAADWLIREHTPAWLRLAGLTAQADSLSSLPEITDFAQCPSLMPALNAARRGAVAARDAAWDATRAAAGDAAWAAAVAATEWDAAGDAARAAARAAAWDTARAASVSAARAAMNDTKWAVQKSAQNLVIRMCEVSA